MVYSPVPGEETFELTDDEKQPGSYLPVDLTTTDPVVMIASYWWIQLLLPPLQPLYYPTIYFNRLKDPTYIPYKSALDIYNSISKFDVVIETNTTTHHDVLPVDVIDPIVSELVLINKFLQNISINDDYNIIGSTIKAGYHVTNFLPPGNVIIQNDAIVIITASESIVLQNGFKVNEGGYLLLEVDKHLNVSCNDETRILKEYSNSAFNSKNNNAQSNYYKDTENNLYPNPSKGKYTYESCKEIYSYCIYSPTGNIVLKKNVNYNRKKITFNISDQNCGVYFLKIIQAGESKIYKLVKY